MTKIAGALNMLPKTMLRQSIINPSIQEAMRIYRTDKNHIMAQWFFCRLILASAKYSRIPSRGGRGSSADIKGIFGDKNYSRFYHNFLIESDNGRSSLRIANTFSLEVSSVELDKV
jgi:hypothetical protein